MKCSDVLNRALSYDPEICHLTQDSRQVRPGSLFFCCAEGKKAQTFINDARARGAAAVVTVSDGDIDSAEPRKDYALACSRFWGEPQKDMKLIAITGTNGKSSVAWLLRFILNQCKGSCGLIGTICNQIDDKQISATYTTPDAGQLYPLLAQMKNRGCEYVVLEASSQAIAQQRLAGLTFDCGVFTNLSRDHLDQHGTMEEYFSVKRSIFTQCKNEIVNQDDKYGLILREKDGLTSYSLYNDSADYWVSDCITNSFGSVFCVNKGEEKVPVHLNQPGEFFVSNGLAALAAANLLGVSLVDGANALEACPSVPGRAELAYNGNFGVMIDYAHTSDGLENIFRMAKGMKPRHIYVVFGCAGQRDRGDRKAMAETVLHYAKKAVYTADNPREETWEQLCADIGRNEFIVPIFDRKKAIETALSWCEKGDLLLLLGKGHEEYQVYDEKTVFFCEKEILYEILGRKTEKH